jgi:plastocyanin domain-containing protein
VVIGKEDPMRALHLRHHEASPATGPKGPATAEQPRIVVHDGYHPDAVTVDLGHPVRITFHREDKSPCSEHVMFEDFGVKTFLPLHEDVTIELHPERAGDYPFTCGMGMLRGTLTVRPPAGEDPSDERHQP